MLYLNLTFYKLFQNKYKSNIYFIKPFFLYLIGFYKINDNYFNFKKSFNFIDNNNINLNNNLKNIFFLNFTYYLNHYIFKKNIKLQVLTFNNSFYYNKFKLEFYTMWLYICFYKSIRNLINIYI